MNDALDNLIVYQASAGSGKTYRLTLEYLTLLFEGMRDENTVKYNAILVVTFTNKATVELRERILGKLYDLTRGTSDMECPLLATLWGEGAVTDPGKKKKLRDYASVALLAILEDYSYFRVQTIDSFFQEVVRSFILEIDRLHSGFEVEIDKDTVVALSLDEMLRDMGASDDRQLEDALKTLYDAHAEDDERVKLQKDLAKIMSDFIEDPLSPDVMQKDWAYLDHEKVSKAAQQLNDIRRAIEEHILSVRKDALDFLNGIKEPPYSFPLKESFNGCLNYQYNTLNASDKDFLEKWFKEPEKLIAGYIEPCLEATESDPLGWVSQRNQKKYASVLEEINKPLRETLDKFVRMAKDDKLRCHYRSALVMGKYLRWIPVLVKFRKKIDDFQSDNGIVLIREVNELLADIIKGTDTPFIYDKVGTRIEHYLIDEFQDTNATQWTNFLPLLVESLANGHRNYIVGDVKQSIYRFRGGDSELLGEKLPAAKGPENIEKLDKNYRSLKVIVDFNNAFFSGIYDFDAFIDEENRDENGKLKEEIYPEEVKKLGFSPSHKAIYEPDNVCQYQPEGSTKSGGFVSVRNKDFGQEDLKELITSLIGDGYKPGDIAILVRKKKEAAQIADLLNRISSEVGEAERDKFRFISSSALLIGNAFTVQFLTSFLHFLANPAVRSAEDLFEVTLFNLVPYTEGEPPERKNELCTELREQLVTLSLAGLSLYELVNASIEVISTVRPIPTEEMVYVNAFLDKLFDFTGRYPSTYGRFDEWWQSQKDSLYIEMSTSSVNAIRLHTIHTVKGLEFPVVILPYADWDIVPTASGKECTKLYDIRRDAEDERKDEVRTLPVQDAERLAYPSDPDYFYYHSAPTKKNTNSIFLKSLSEELEATYMDSLNLLYVAFTRPSERLYVYVGKAEKKEEKGEESEGQKQKKKADKQKKLVGTGRIIAGSLRRFAGFDICKEDLPYRLGEEQPAAASEEGREDELISVLSATPKYDGLVMRKKRFTSSRIERGEELHALMERVDTPDDFDKVLGGRKEVFEAEISAFRTSVSVPDTPAHFFFTPRDGWITLKEHSMYSPEAGRTLRTDRLMLNPATRTALVLDYKFGAEEAAHSRQIGLYLGSLRRMGYYRARGFLWYNFTKMTEVTE